MSEQQTVLVTGGSGFIGTMICLQLVEAGYNVINIDRDKKKKELPGTTLYPFDISNHQVDGIIQLTKPDTIIHLAADHEVGRSVLEPDVFYENNVANTIGLLNSAIKAGVKNFVFSSTSSVYGDTHSFPTAESEPMLPVSPYGRSKAFVEDLLWDYTHAHSMRFVSLRYFNAAGADPDMRHGYTQDPASHLVPIVCRNALSGETLTVYGNDYDTPDGTCERDYTHVWDIASAHLSAMDYLNAGGDSNVFNIGAGNSTSVLGIVEALERVTGASVNCEYGERRAGDPAKTYSDISKAHSVLGWQPKYGIDDIVAHAYQWEQTKGKKR